MTVAFELKSDEAVYNFIQFLKDNCYSEDEVKEIVKRGEF